ncbi:MAG: type II toxin-antitoxin system HipA family toxin YjjJ [Proteobacteria bacterium]|nr:type II toxin-antitoxin system HipA family toxin YjjJ [Pseudomonadota bacterium]
MSTTVLQFLKTGSANSRQIQLATGLSQPVVSRRLAKLSEQIVTDNKQRPPVYSLLRNAFGAGNKIHISMVDAHGNNNIVGYLRPIEPKGFYLEVNNKTPTPLLACEKGYFSDLPYFLDDLRLQGFLGRQTAKQISLLSDDFPTKLQYWTSEQVGRFLTSNGDDLTGNIKLGEQLYLRLCRKPKKVTRTEYSQLADEVLQGENIGSSAAGEQPKFTVFNKELDQHVIVKFSPKGANEISQRWRDILISEHHALQALNKFNIIAAKTQLVEDGERLFLESIRFDRNGMFGRLSMVSLQAIDMAFVGTLENWHSTVKQLLKQKLCTGQDYETVKLLSAFGKLINNTDMHHGNISFSIESDKFRLLPIYDMCCMGFAPKVGEVLPYKFQQPNIENLMIDNLKLNTSQLKVLENSLEHFWTQLLQDKRISQLFREYIAQISI